MVVDYFEVCFVKKTLFIIMIAAAWVLTGCNLDPGVTPLPYVTVSSPAANDTVVGPILSVTGTAGDGSGIEGVYVNLDGLGYSRVIGTVAWATNYTGMTNTTSHTIQVYAKGLSGITSQTNTITFNLNYNTNIVKAWTIMIYLDGDNNLEPYAVCNFNDMEKGLLAAMNSGARDIMSNLNIIVMFDRRGLYYGETVLGQGPWSDTRLFLILPDADPVYFGSERLDDGLPIIHHIGNLGELPMDSTNTLQLFIGYTMTNFPAQNYALILWDHGAGVKTICQDDTSGGSAMYIGQVRQAMLIPAYQPFTNNLRIIGFDACYMATVEIGYEFRTVANFLVASMQTEDNYGWDYNYWFGHLFGSKDIKSISPSDLSKLVVDGYHDFHVKKGDTLGDTMSVVNLSLMAPLKTSIDSFASSIFYESNKTLIESVRETSIHFYTGDLSSVDIPLYDLYDFANKINVDTPDFSPTLRNSANNVMTALANSVVYAYGGNGNGQSYYYGDGSTVKKGLSLFFSRGDHTYTSDSGHDAKVSSGTFSQFYFQWWYTSTNVSTWWTGHYFGNLDFCDSDQNGTVNTWRELLKAWYDPAANVNTPGSY
jgi:clostripain